MEEETEVAATSLFGTLAKIVSHSVEVEAGGYLPREAVGAIYVHGDN